MKTNPNALLENEPQWLAALQVGPGTLLSLARDPSTLDAVAAALEQLLPDAYIEHVRQYYSLGRERFGTHWNYADQLTVLHAAARVLRPRSYLEIGVFRGRSLSVVAAAAPECALYAFDQWIPGYAGLDNSGPELVREQLRRVGHRGAVHIESGDSHETVPRFLAQHAELGFDLITVDGDHTEDGARLDLETVLPRLNVGGALVFDDIRHPSHPWLERVWDDTVGMLPGFACEKFVEVGSGVALALRRNEDDAVTRALSGSGSNRLAQLAHALDELRAKRVERIAILETEMARRLALIEQQGTELGRIPALEAELARLHESASVADAERARQAQVILEYAQALEAGQADNARLRERLERLGEVENELRLLRGGVREQFALLHDWVERNMVGLLRRRQADELRAVLQAAAARLLPGTGPGSPEVPADAPSGEPIGKPRSD